MKIALAQIFCLDNDGSGNLVRIENAIAEACEKGADLVAFPESVLLGWLNPAAHRRASPIPGKESIALCQLAAKYKIYLSVGLDEKEEEALYGSALLIDDLGNILLKHRKLNVLPHLMTPPYSQGNEVHVSETRFGRIGILVCADTFQEDLLARMKRLKPDLLLVPYGWTAAEENWPQHQQALVKVVQHAAQLLNCPVMGTNSVGQVSSGPWAGRTYGGGSVACNEKGEVIALGKDRDRDVLLISLTLASGN